MNTRWTRFRRWVVRRLVRNDTKYVVVWAHELDSARREVEGLREYVDKSGSLTHPRRIKARRMIRHSLSRLSMSLQQGEVES